MPVGSKFTIKQHKNDDGSIGTISLYNNKYGTRSYRGDMNFDISGGSLRLINKVYIEDYLYGVLAGELSNTFPLETLKAQAIIARSYVYNRMTGREPNYEINDTSGDQVYKGYNASNNVIMKAVDETAGSSTTDRWSTPISVRPTAVRSNCPAMPGANLHPWAAM